jgi:integrase/recombinase XerD
MEAASVPHELISVQAKLNRLGFDTVPPVIRTAGADATHAFLEFFTARIRNRNTRQAYAHACARFLSFCDDRSVRLDDIEPMLVAAYIEELGRSLATASVKQHLAAIRMMFDYLTEKQVLAVNPSRAVRGPKHVVVEGTTPAFDVKQARTLLASIDTTTIIGLRDRGILATLIYTAARVGAVCNLRVKDFAQDGSQWCLRFGEKGGKRRKIPCRADLEQYIREYINAAAHAHEKDAPLFRTVDRRRRLTDRGVHRVEINAMLKRRLKRAGLPMNLSCHSFRATTATDLLDQSVPLEDVQYLLGHCDPRTTRLYDRRKKQVTRNIVERISV